jgi:hypothetical protein
VVFNFPEILLSIDGRASAVKTNDPLTWGVIGDDRASLSWCRCVRTLKKRAYPFHSIAVP